MNAVRRIELIGIIKDLSGETSLSTKSMDALVGCRDHPDQKVVRALFPKFSWVAKKALQMALIVHRHGRASFDGQVSMIEIGKLLPAMKGDETLAIVTALRHGAQGLRSIKKQVKLLRIRK